MEAAALLTALDDELRATNEALERAESDLDSVEAFLNAQAAITKLNATFEEAQAAVEGTDDL